MLIYQRVYHDIPYLCWLVHPPFSYWCLVSREWREWSNPYLWKPASISPFPTFGTSRFFLLKPSILSLNPQLSSAIPASLISAHKNQQGGQWIQRLSLKTHAKLPHIKWWWWRWWWWRWWWWWRRWQLSLLWWWRLLLLLFIIAMAIT